MGRVPILTPASPMLNQRHWATATVLADGDVLVSGGSTVQNADTGPVAYQPELWDPDTDTWTTMDSHEKMRLYHSSSLLLPDGRVLIGGGGQPGPQLNLNAEVYSPPYLFDGDQPAVRPEITSAPSKVRYNEAFEIEVEGDVAAVSFVRTGAMTHSFDASTRWMELEVSGTNGERIVRAPANANLAPPGSYMLFALDSDGTPSVAKLIEIDPGEPVGDSDDPDPTPESGTVAEAETLEEILAASDYDPVVHGNILRLYRAFFGREPDFAGAQSTGSTMSISPARSSPTSSSGSPVPTKSNSQDNTLTSRSTTTGPTSAGSMTTCSAECPTAVVSTTGVP